MNPFTPAILVILAATLARGAEAPATPATAPSAPPIVRLPVSPAAAADQSSAGPTSTVVSAAGTTGATLSTGQPELVGQGASLRQASGGASVQTNRVVGARGVLPRLAKPERKGVGGFFSGFANLFNPFAPMREGVGGSTENWYDGQVNRAPLPRGMRDEKSHEPTTELVGFRAEPPLEPPPAKPAR